MLAKLTTYTLVGIEAHRVEVEVDVSPSVSSQVTLVGLPAASLQLPQWPVVKAIRKYSPLETWLLHPCLATTTAKHSKNKDGTGTRPEYGRIIVRTS